MEIRFLGHSAFTLSDGDATVVESHTSSSVVVLEPGESWST
jgi:hypothetical protein